MAKNKKKKMPPEALSLVAARFKVLSEPLRLRIIQALEDGELSVNEITEEVESSQPNVSKHLKVLQDAGIVGRRQEGTTIYCFVADQSVLELCDVVCSSVRDRLHAQAQALAF